MKYDYLIVGSGLYGATFAHKLHKAGKTCLVIDKRNHIGGNTYCKNVGGIQVHQYGAHIFHTNDKRIWDFVNSFVPFKPFINSPKASYYGAVFNLPFNMHTFEQLWGVKTTEEAQQKIEEETAPYKKTQPANLKEQALSMAGPTIFEKLIKHYTEKQWGKLCSELPPSIIKRLPVRFTWDSNYFNDKYTGMPIGGYTQIFDKMLEGSEVRLGVDYFKEREYLDSLADKIIYTGPIDKFFDYRFGKLDYRSLTWSTKILDSDNFQGVPVVNYTDEDTPYTRILEHKWFDPQNQKGTIISYEYPADYNGENEPYYPIRDDKNTKTYEMYRELTKSLKSYYFGGRLATYVYYDMHQVIAQALKMLKEIE
jgi:UDP-galactopyranose mutase